MTKRRNITHLIIGLGKGGAETALYNLLKFKTDYNIKYKVISFGLGNYYSKYIAELDVELIELDLKRKPIFSLLKAKKHIKGSDILNCWMYHSNFIGYILAKFAGVKKIVWNIRHSNLDPNYNKATTIRINEICAKLSKNVSVVTYNGEQAKLTHEAIGYDKTKSCILLNGCDTEIYRKVSNSKDYVSKMLEFNTEEVSIVLSASRYNPIKDIPNFIRSFSKMKQNYKDVIAVMCGNGIDENNEELLSIIRKHDLLIGEDIFILGRRDDLPILMSACDLYVLHSIGEAFPNTLIEAMACEATCISTDVGDVYNIIDSKYIVPPNDSTSLSNLMNIMLSKTNLQKEIIGKRNRDLVLEKYSIHSIVNYYEEIYWR